MNFDALLIYVVSYFGLFTAIFFFSALLDNRDKLKTPKIKEYAKVSVIVPAYNEEATILKTIKSLLNLDYPKDKLEIIVVDDGSTDGTLRIAKSIKNSNVKVFTKKNGGKGSALNFGLKMCAGKFVAALDADSFVASNALKKMLGYFEDKDVMAVTPSLKVYKPKNFLQRIQLIEYLIGIFLRKIFAILDSIHVAPGPFSIFRKEFFDRYGGYDENNLTEDIEIALRIKSKKFKIENAADAIVYTLTPPSFTGLLKQRLRWYYGFMENVLHYRHLFSRKYSNLGVFILPAAFISVALVIVVLFYAIFRFITRTLVQNYKNLSSINFDFSRLFDFHFDPFFVNLNSVAVLSILCLIIGICMIIMAKKISKETSRIKFSYLSYLLFYWVLFGVWWLTAIFYKVSGRKVVWRHKVTK